MDEKLKMLMDKLGISETEAQDIQFNMPELFVDVWVIG